ncbi:MAG: hypothetical protein PHO48_01400 [Candidatus Gracilibacteria bacterium]|nr:hypothetical protein [Candidatus Gracilibacteria bacterium]MDD5178768.1 hypothetical protein [Candidatus Gracilibacteria bacterium]
MKKLVLILATVLLLGCEANVGEELKPEENKNEAIADNFEKNQECAKLAPAIEKRLKDFREEKLKSGESLVWLPTFQEIFYSPKTNSCLYIDNVQMGKEDPFTMKRLVDVSDGVAVDPVDDMSCMYISNRFKYNEIVGDEKFNSDCEEFDRKIEEEYKR